MSAAGDICPARCAYRDCRPWFNGANNDLRIQESASNHCLVGDSGTLDLKDRTNNLHEHLPVQSCFGVTISLARAVSSIVYDARLASEEDSGDTGYVPGGRSVGGRRNPALSIVMTGR